MDKKTGGIIATIVAVLLCGCPGLAFLCFGAVTALVSFVPGSDIDIFGSSNPQSAMATGISLICVSIIFIAIPIVVGVLTLRKKPEQAVTFNEPLPPAA
jgi:hypothetical protein